MKTTIKTALFALSILTVSCEPAQNEDIVQSPSKDGSIETIVSVKHEANFDILTTVNKVWVKNSLNKTITKIDTLPSLGITTQEAENDEGETKTVSLPKNYEIYITVK